VSGGEELLEAAICDSAELTRQAALFSEADLVRFFNSLADTENLLRTASHPRYQVEIGLVKLMEMRRLEPLSSLMDRLNTLETALRSGKPFAAKTATESSRAVTSGSSPANPPSANKTTPAVASTPRYGSGSSAGAATRTAFEAKPETEIAAGISAAVAEVPWEQPKSVTKSNAKPAGGSAIDQIKASLEQKRKMFLVTALEGASRVAIENDELFIEFAPADRHLRDTLSKSDNIKMLREVCKDVTGDDLGVRFLIADGAGADAPVSKEETERREKQDLRAQAEKDPVVQQMLKTFRGEIVDVKRVDRD
jgi:DNA polymerase III gamma/tau subunit